MYFNLIADTCDENNFPFKSLVNESTTFSLVLMLLTTILLCMLNLQMMWYFRSTCFSLLWLLSDSWALWTARLHPCYHKEVEWIPLVQARNKLQDEVFSLKNLFWSLWCSNNSASRWVNNALLLCVAPTHSSTIHDKHVPWGKHYVAEIWLEVWSVYHVTSGLPLSKTKI